MGAEAELPGFVEPDWAGDLGFTPYSGLRSANKTAAPWLALDVGDVLNYSW